MATERMQIVGIEISEGISKKSGRPYSMGTLYSMTKLAPPMGSEDNVAKGYMGDKFETDVSALRKVAHLPFPIVADVDIDNVMRFGERKQTVSDIRPVDVIKKQA